MPETGKADRARNGAAGLGVAESPRSSADRNDTTRAILEQSELLREAIVRITNLETRLSAMGDAADWGQALMGAVASLQDRVGAAIARRGDAAASGDGDLDSIRASIERISGRIGVVESLREPIADLAPRVAALDDLRTAFGEMPVRLDQMAARADQLSSRMDVLTTSVESLRALPGQIRSTLSAAEKRFEARATDAFTRFSEAATSLRADLSRLTETLRTDVQHANDAARADVQQAARAIGERVDAAIVGLSATVETQVGDLRREVEGMAQSLRTQVVEAGRAMRADLSSSVTEELAELHEPARALSRAAGKIPSQDSLSESLHQAAGELGDAVRARVDVLTTEVRARVDGLSREMAALREGVALKDATVLERVGTRLEQVLREVDLVGNALNEVWARVCAVEDVVRTANGLPAAPADQAPPMGSHALPAAGDPASALTDEQTRPHDRRSLASLFRRKRDDGVARLDASSGAPRDDADPLLDPPSAAAVEIDEEFFSAPPTPIEPVVAEPAPVQPAASPPRRASSSRAGSSKAKKSPSPRAARSPARKQAAKPAP